LWERWPTQRVFCLNRCKRVHQIVMMLKYRDIVPFSIFVPLLFVTFTWITCCGISINWDDCGYCFYKITIFVANNSLTFIVSPVFFYPLSTVSSVFSLVFDVSCLIPLHTNELSTMRLCERTNDFICNTDKKRMSVAWIWQSVEK